MQQSYGLSVRRTREVTGVSLRRAAVAALITPSYLSRIETGQRPPPDGEVRSRIASAINASKAEIVRLEARARVELVAQVEMRPSGPERELAVIIVRGRRAKRLVDSLLADAKRASADWGVEM